MASPSPIVGHPAGLLTSPQVDHPANVRLRAQAVAQLQRQRGNSYVQRLIRSAGIQAQLVASPPRAEHELEPDRVAEEEMWIPELPVRGQPRTTPELESRIPSSEAGGHTPDGRVRGQMGAAFGADLSSVRVHPAAEADSMARMIGARAFTIGKDVFLARDAPGLASIDGRELLRHELVHVLQQTDASLTTPVRVTDPSEAAENEA